jgi:hypothetical protein
MDVESDTEEDLSPPLSVPEKEDEPQPEPATIPPILEPSTSTIKATKRVRIAIQDGTEAEDPYARCFVPQYPCRWSSCEEAFFDVNDLYDHTTEHHLNGLRPSGSGVVVQDITNRRARSAISEEDEKVSEEKFRCQWKDCEMSLKRGTEEKKVGREISFLAKMSLSLANNGLTFLFSVRLVVQPLSHKARPKSTAVEMSHQELPNPVSKREGIA